MSVLFTKGATRAQASAAIKKYKDVMEAAEHIFDGEFENVKDVPDMIMDEPGSSKNVPHRLAVCPKLISALYDLDVALTILSQTPDSDEDANSDEEMEDDDDEGKINCCFDPGETAVD